MTEIHRLDLDANVFVAVLASSDAAPLSLAVLHPEGPEIAALLDKA